MKCDSKGSAKVRAELSVASINKMAKRYLVKSAEPGGPVDECHAYSFEIYASGTHSGFVYVTFPRDYVESEGSDEVLNWFCDWNQRFEFSHAGAGYGWELAWFPEQAQHAGPTMLTTGLRFHGVRVWERRQAWFRERNKTTMDTVAWLTYLGKDAISDIGGTAKLSRLEKGVEQHTCGPGVVLQAGPRPDPCDTNRRGAAYALLKSINDAIIPIRSTKWWIKGWGSKDAEKELGWFSRMDG
jgi:hypothetical protein